MLKSYWLTAIFLHLPVRAEALRAALGTAGHHTLMKGFALHPFCDGGGVGNAPKNCNLKAALPRKAAFKHMLFLRHRTGQRHFPILVGEGRQIVMPPGVPLFLVSEIGNGVDLAVLQTAPPAQNGHR